MDLSSAATNVVIDHCDALVSTDENISSFGNPPENFTFQWSFNAWGLSPHSAGGFWYVKHATSHHSLWAHNHTRDPKELPPGWALIRGEALRQRVRAAHAAGRPVAKGWHSMKLRSIDVFTLKSPRGDEGT
jgi:hypothetical protein